MRRWRSSIRRRGRSWVTPDGSRAYVAVNGDNHVAIVDLKALEETGRISTGNGPDGMAWAVR